MAKLRYPDDIESKSDIADLTPDAVGVAYSDKYVNFTNVVDEAIADLIGIHDENILVPYYESVEEVQENMISREAKLQSAVAIIIVGDQVYKL